MKKKVSLTEHWQGSYHSTFYPRQTQRFGSTFTLSRNEETVLLLVLVPQVECQTIIHKITYWAQISAMEYIWNPAKHHTHCFSRHQKLTSKYLVLITLFLRVFSYILIIWFACMSKRGIMQVFRITLQLPILQPVMARFFFITLFLQPLLWCPNLRETLF